ncbi:MAG TPA: BrnT family toxin [Terriglobia bacterium]|nr:BrnT family toxin [Terriglobia bacterium]
MRFEWDEEKARRNLEKHKVSFEQAKRVFDDPHHVSLRDDREPEERWLTFGLVNGAVVLAVAHTVEERENEETIRIISARKATRCERERYAHPYEKR